MSTCATAGAPQRQPATAIHATTDCRCIRINSGCKYTSAGGRDRPRKPRGIDGDVGLHVGQLDGRLHVGLARRPGERHLDAGHLAVVGVVDLRRDGAERGHVPPHQPDEQPRLVEVQVHGRLSLIPALHDVDEAPVDGGAAHLPLAEELPDARRERDHRFDPGELQVALGQRDQRGGGIGPGQPPAAAIEDPEHLSRRQAGHRRALIRRPREHFHREFVESGVEPRIRTLARQAGQRGDAGGAADCLEVLVEHLIDRDARVRHDRHQVGIFVRRAVLEREARRRLRRVRAAVAGEAAHARRAAEVVLVERLHHDDHLARALQPRGRDREGVAVEDGILGVAVGAVAAHRRGKHPHDVEERVDVESLEELDVLEVRLRGERRSLTRLRRGGRLAATCRCDAGRTDAQRAGDQEAPAPPPEPHAAPTSCCGNRRRPVGRFGSIPRLSGTGGRAARPAAVGKFARSEADVGAELQDPRLDDRRRHEPARPVGVGQRENRARVQQVVEVQISLHAHTRADADNLRDTHVDPRDAVFVLRLRHDERHARRAGVPRERTAERSRDLGGGRRAFGEPLHARQILVDQAHHGIAGQRVAAVELDLRVRRHGRRVAARAPAVDRGRGVRDRNRADPRHVGRSGDAGKIDVGPDDEPRRVDVEADVLQNAPRVDAAAEAEPRCEAGIDGEPHEVGHLPLVAEIRRRADQVVHLAELVRVDVVEPAHVEAAAARQPRIARRRHAVGAEVGRRHGEVVGHQEVAEPVPVVAGRDRHGRSELPLHLGGHVPVVGADAESLQHLVRIARRDAGPPEVLVLIGTALAVGGRAPQVALRDVVLVEVVPRARHLVHRRDDRVVLAGDVDAGLPRVPADRDLQRHAAVAVDVVGGAHARIEVGPRRHVGDAVEPPLRQPAERVRGDRLRRHVGVEVLEARAEVEREATNRPLILRVEPEVGPHPVLERVRRRVLREADGDAVVERVGHVVVVRRPELPEPALLVVHPDLERMRAGHVRDREPLAVPPLLVRIVGRDPRVVAHAGRLLEDGDVAGLHAGRAELRPVVDGERRRAVEEQPVGHGRAPRRLIHPRRPEMIGIERLRRLAAVVRRVGAADAGVLHVREDVDLVPLGRLPRQAQRVRLEPLVRVGGPVEVRRVERCALRLVPVDAGEQPAVAPFAMRGEEPEAIALDRPAHRHAGVVDFEQLAAALEPPIAERPGQVVAGEAPLRVDAGEAAREEVAALLRNDVHEHAVRVALGGDAAGLHRDLLDDRRVELVAEVARAGEVLDAHAVDLHARAGLAVEPFADLRRVAAGHVGHAGQARRQRNQHVVVLVADRENREGLLGHEQLASDVLGVDQRGLASHGDRLLDRADRHVGVHRRGEPRRQHDALAAEGGEPGQRERHRVGARAQVDDVVPAFGVADDDAHLFDERRTAGLDGHAGQHAAGGVAHRAGDAAGLLGLRAPRERGQKHDAREQRYETSQHHSLLGLPWSLLLRLRALLLFAFERARRGQRVGQTVVPLVAGVLVEHPVGAEPWNRHGPRPNPRLRIAHRELVVDRRLVDAAKALDQHHLLRRAAERRGARRIREVRRLDDQRVALPPAARVSQPLPHRPRNVRTAVHGDEARLVNLLLEDRHVPGRLHDLVVVVVAGRQARQRAADDAAAVDVEVLGAGGELGLAPVRVRLGSDARPPRRRHRGNAPVRRVDDEGGAAVGQDPLAAVPPEVVVRRVHVAQRPRLPVVGVDLPAQPRLILGGLGLGQVRPAGELRRPLERRQRLVRPDALQIRVAPRRAKRARLRLRDGCEAKCDDHTSDGGKRLSAHIRLAFCLVPCALCLVPCALYLPLICFLSPVYLFSCPASPHTAPTR